MYSAYMDSDGVYMRVDGENGTTWSRIGSAKDITIKCDDLESNVEQDYNSMRFYNYWLKTHKENNAKKAFYDLEGEDCCEYCPYRDECHGITSGPNGPIYPYCADNNIYAVLDYEKFKKDYLREFKEEKIMEILEIYKVRKMKAIDQEFEEKRESLENNNEIINRYKEIVNTFKADMDEFVNEEKVKASGFIMQTPYFDNYRYELNRPKISELFDDINKERTDKFQELDRLIDEVKAMISIVPKDGNYDAKVIEILKSYEILDKKGKINA